MKAFIVGDTNPAQLLLVDEKAYESEVAFEACVMKSLSLLYPQHYCIVFGGEFVLDFDSRRSDLALVAKDFSHWFVVEVELLSHSLEGHVLPQVRTMRYGELVHDCASSLARELHIGVGEAKTLIDRVPRVVAVITNGYSPEWALALRYIDVQYLTITPYVSHNGTRGFDIQGDLEILQHSIGFGIYDAVASTIRMPMTVDLPNGALQIEGPDGVLSEWTVIRENGFTWLVKVGVRLNCQNRSYIQVMRAIGGKLSLRV